MPDINPSVEPRPKIVENASHLSRDEFPWEKDARSAAAKDPKYAGMQSTLEALVPLIIHDIAERGGPTDRDYERIKRLIPVIAERGDAMQFPSDTNAAEKADLKSAWPEFFFAVGVMAFQPAGVRLFGIQFDAGMPGMYGGTGKMKNVLPPTIPLLQEIAEAKRQEYLQVISTKLEAIYKRIPTVACKGECQEYCGPIAFDTAEVANVRQRGFPLPTVTNLSPDHASCSALDAKGRCTIYAARPLVCRLYGVIRGPKMACPHGCRPKRWLTQSEASAIMAEVKALLPGDRYWTHPAGADLPIILQHLASEGIAPKGGWR